jgi:hypothetical protein
VVRNNGRQSGAPCELCKLLGLQRTDRSPANFGTLQPVSSSFSSTEVIEGYKDHSTVCDQVEECLDLAMLFELSTNLVTVSLILNVADEKSAARTLALNAFFNNRLVHLIVSFTFRTTFGQSSAIASGTTITRTSAI